MSRKAGSDNSPWRCEGKVSHVVFPEVFFPSLTPVQQQTMPLLLSNKDVNVEVGVFSKCVILWQLQACTGSGKTLAYVIPAVEMLLRRHSPLRPGQAGVIVVVPTRELALQVSRIFKQFTEIAPCPLGVLTLIGGGAVKPLQLSPGQRTDVVVATPGRLDTHLGRGEIDAHALEILVLDEADRSVRNHDSTTSPTSLQPTRDWVCQHTQLDSFEAAKAATNGMTLVAFYHFPSFYRFLGVLRVSSAPPRPQKWLPSPVLACEIRLSYAYPTRTSRHQKLCSSRMRQA